MVVILRMMGGRCILARPKEVLLAKTRIHFMPFAWLSAAIFAMLGIIGVGILFGALFNRDLLFVLALVLAVLLYVYAFRFAPNPFQVIVITDRSLYWVRWGRVGFRWGVSGFTEISLESVVSVQVKKPFLGRYFDYGDISLRMGTEPNEITLQYVPFPAQFRSVIQNAMAQVSALPPIQEVDVLNVNNELQNALVRQQIDQEEYESAMTGSFGQHTS